MNVVKTNATQWDDEVFTVELSAVEYEELIKTIMSSNRSLAESTIDLVLRGASEGVVGLSALHAATVDGVASRATRRRARSRWGWLHG